MSKTIVQINYKIMTAVAEHMALIEPAAAVPGLIWKIWLQNEAEHEVGGIDFRNVSSGERIAKWLVWDC